jgi:hypothetical protein
MASREPTCRYGGDASDSSFRATGVDAKSAPRLSIVVLPFSNLSNDPEQEYFADGITDDLTTDLSRISGSSPTYPQAPQPTKDLILMMK